MKTAKQVQTDVFDLLRLSSLAGVISGRVYRKGTRPRDSRAEDATVAFTAGVPGQIEEGVVTVNVYVPDIDPYGHGDLYEDARRTAEIETLAADWAESLNSLQSEYLFQLRQTIYTEAAEDIAQHFVVVRLGFRRLDQ